jgi:hypothetical protein
MVAIRGLSFSKSEVPPQVPQGCAEAGQQLEERVASPPLGGDSRASQGFLAHKKLLPPRNLREAYLCLGLYGGPRRVEVFHECAIPASYPWVPYFLHSETSLDALNLRSDGISSIKILSLGGDSCAAGSTGGGGSWTATATACGRAHKKSLPPRTLQQAYT